MKREILSQALDRLDERHISDTAVFSPGAVRGSPERIGSMKAKRIVTLALAAALLLALGTAAYASFGSRSIGTHAMPGEGDYSRLSDLERVEEAVGYPVTAPERFSNGYSFSLLTVRGEAVFDENNEVEKEYYSVHVNYQKPGSPDRYLDLNPTLGPARFEPCELRTIGGVPVRLSLDHYKVVPADYRETEEDLAKEASGHYYISFGSDRITEYDIAGANFTLDGVDYELSDMSASQDTLEELAQMAEELIAAAKN